MLPSRASAESLDPVELLRELIWFLIDAFRRSADWLERRLGDLDDLIAFQAERLGPAWPDDFRGWQEARRQAAP